MNSSIRISILSSLGLLLLAQLIYLPVLLSIIFIIILISLYFSLQPGRQPIAKYWTFSLIALALLSIYLQYRAFIGVEAGVAVLSTFLFAKALETRTRRDVIILFNFALFVSASSFLFSQSIWMAFMVILSLLSCLIGLYRLQTSEFEYQASAVQALKRDARHVGRFVLYALPFLSCCLCFSHGCRRCGIFRFRKIKALPELVTACRRAILPSYRNPARWPFGLLAMCSNCHHDMSCIGGRWCWMNMMASAGVAALLTSSR